MTSGVDTPVRSRFRGLNHSSLTRTPQQRRDVEPMPHEAAVYLDSRCLRTPARVLEARMLQHAESTLVALNHEQEDHDDEAASDEVSTGLLRRDREPERIGPGQLARQTLRSHRESRASRHDVAPVWRAGRVAGLLPAISSPREAARAGPRQGLRSVRGLGGDGEEDCDDGRHRVPVVTADCGKTNPLVESVGIRKIRKFGAAPSYESRPEKAWWRRLVLT